MSQGKILIVNKVNGSIIGWFGENDNDSRPTLDNIVLVELEPSQYASQFISLQRGLEGIKVTSIENRTLEFDLSPISPTPEEQILQLQQDLLIAQGVI